MSRHIEAKPSVTLTEAELKLRKTESGKLILTKHSGRNVALLLQNNRLISALFFKSVTSHGSRVGDIFIGKIKNVTKNIDACFVEIAHGEMCFLPLKKASEPVLLNRTYDGRLVAGDEIIVQVEKEAQKSKQAQVTCKLKCKESKELEDIISQAEHKKCFSCLKRELTSPISEPLHYFSKEEYTEIITDCKEFLVDDVEIRYYEDKLLSLNGLYGIESKLKEALERRIWLKSGGYLVFDTTEALTVIDVNSGKLESRKDAEENFLKINLEAAEEVARQLRLRNLSGIIIVDFINMKSQENKKVLLTYFRELLSNDPTKTLLVDMTALGLVEITRKKAKMTLQEQFNTWN